jgi:argininosuccinate lyase
VVRGDRTPRRPRQPARPAGGAAKPWAGRFAADTDKVVEAYTASIDVDRRLYRQDIAGSIAHARMLARQGIIPKDDAEAIVRGLEEVHREIEEGRFPWRPELEDVHMNIEARLAEKAGEAAGRLHTARSRNDQVVTDLRLYAKEAIARAMTAVHRLQGSILDLAEANRDVVVPGYTHLQRAQPLLLAHHLLAYFEMLDRDASRFADCLARTDVLPLGSGALTGVPYPIDRETVARELGFARVSENSVDAVSDRDFVVEFLAAAAVCVMHLSRLAEEIVLWSSAEFGFAVLPDAFATGSSIMPQKKNPDVAELARGRTGRVYGHLVSVLTMLKGQPLAYNRDLQEDKQALFEAEDVLLSTLDVFARMLPALRFDGERALAAASAGYVLATDLADYLVRKGLPFREAHAAVGKLVRYAEERGKAFSELSLAEYRRFSKEFDADVLKLDVRAALAARDVPGGTAPRRVRTALRRARRRLRSVTSSKASLQAGAAAKLKPGLRS